MGIKSIEWNEREQKIIQLSGWWRRQRFVEEVEWIRIEIGSWMRWRSTCNVLCNYLNSLFTSLTRIAFLWIGFSSWFVEIVNFPHWYQVCVEVIDVTKDENRRMRRTFRWHHKIFSLRGWTFFSIIYIGSLLTRFDVRRRLRRLRQEILISKCSYNMWKILKLFLQQKTYIEQNFVERRCRHCGTCEIRGVNSIGEKWERQTFSL